MKDERIRWGICGAGNIAGHFASTLNATGGRIAAVASTDADRAEAFRAKYGAERAYCGYEAMAEAGAIDAAYIATHHPYHASAAEPFLLRGIPVLSEKPLSIDLAGVKRMRAAAKAGGALLMEAMWTRFLPVTEGVLETVHGGGIGSVRYADAVFAVRFADKASRAFRNDLAGGGLLDMGVYSMSYLRWLLGDFAEVASCCTIGSTGVDEFESVTVKNAAGVVGHMVNGIVADVGVRLAVYGEKGSLSVPNFNGAQEFTVTVGGKAKTYRFPHEATGFEYEIAHFEELVKSGRRESPVLPLSENEAILSEMDKLREQWGLRFQVEEGKTC